MIRRIAKSLAHLGRSQILALSAQVISAIPVIAMSIYLARFVGLWAVADFAVLVGISSVAFTMGLVGLRSRLVLDRFREFSEDSYFCVRILATVAMAIIILIAGFMLSAPMALTIAVMLLRVGDAALDLVMAIDQVRRTEREHMYGYLSGSILKLSMITVFLGAAEVTVFLSPFPAFAMAMAIYAISTWTQFLNRRESVARLFSNRSLFGTLRLVRYSAAFAVAQILCALVTSAPRFLLQGMPDQDLAGAAGAALSISTLIGMVFFAVWLRWIPRFGMVGLQADRVGRFIGETFVALIIVLVTFWLVGDQVITLVFGITDTGYQRMSVEVLYLSAIFFFVMTQANLFKPSRMPWVESAVYLGGVGTIGIVVLFEPAATTQSILTAGAIGMFFIECLSLALLKRHQRGELRDASESASI